MIVKEGSMYSKSVSSIIASFLKERVTGTALLQCRGHQRVSAFFPLATRPFPFHRGGRVSLFSWDCEIHTAEMILYSMISKSSPEITTQRNCASYTARVYCMLLTRLYIA
ncbi:hypothetical protein KIN20_002789 [Parelaphostrongylus tenuis]|uniref:Uncharacterized protein n=1 Tax=Parelaphostrongylus tenuis TaxID=148309 RepID=A0AAD5QI35_PARTN|nr:hypothetical protein KIN20_002789 [Parelaphostrongylus tenuis]